MSNPDFIALGDVLKSLSRLIDALEALVDNVKANSGGQVHHYHYTWEQPKPAPSYPTYTWPPGTITCSTS